jgi:hypothetical protein
MGPQKLAKFFPLESLCLRTPNPEMLVDRARDYIYFIYTMELFCPTSYSTNLVTHWRNIVFLVHAVLATLWSDAPASLQGLSLSLSLSLSVSLQYLISKSVIPVALGKDFLKVFLSFAVASSQRQTLSPAAGSDLSLCLISAGSRRRRRCPCCRAYPTLPATATG